MAKPFIPRKIISDTQRNCVVLADGGVIAIHRLPAKSEGKLRFKFGDITINKYLVAFGDCEDGLPICAVEGPTTSARIYLTIQVFPGGQDIKQ